MFCYYRGLEQHRSNTFVTGSLLIPARASEDQNLVLLTNAAFGIGLGVCGLKLSREVFKFWKKNLEFVKQLNSKGNKPGESVYLANFSRVKQHQVNWANSRHSGKWDLKKQNKTFKMNFKILLCPVH